MSTHTHTHTTHTHTHTGMATQMTHNGSQTQSQA